MRNGMIANKYGDQHWYVNDRLHREDGPAVIYADGTQQWRVNGQRHRVDGPAVIYAGDNIAQEWWVNGQRHRTDGPAIISDSERRWCLNGQLHRVDGPAIIRVDGSQEWYLNNKDVTDDVNKWMTKLDITYPFDEEHQALFVLTFGGK